MLVNEYERSILRFRLEARQDDPVIRRYGPSQELCDPSCDGGLFSKCMSTSSVTNTTPSVNFRTLSLWPSSSLVRVPE